MYLKFKRAANRGSEGEGMREKKGGDDLVEPVNGGAFYAFSDHIVVLLPII